MLIYKYHYTIINIDAFWRNINVNILLLKSHDANNTENKKSENFNIKNSISDIHVYIFQTKLCKSKNWPDSNYHTSLKLLIPSSSSSCTPVGEFVRGDNLLFLPEI